MDCGLGRPVWCRDLGLRPSHFVVSLGKTGYVHGASLQPGGKINKKITCQCTQK